LRNKKIFAVTAAVIICAIIIVTAFDTRLKTVEYTLQSDKITDEVRIALITDLHSCLYGENQSELFDKIDAYKPDAVLLGGDIFDDVMDNVNSKAFVAEAAEKYKTYYVSGNHEWWSNRMYEFFDYLNSCNVKVLRGECDELNVGESTISICGIDDPEVEVYDSAYTKWEEQLKKSVAKAESDNFTVLLTHRPELAAKYFEYDIDVALSGHAHGGQFIIPFIMNGFFAPNQGFLPKLAGGMYDFDGKKLIVSRGLSRENFTLPRIFNRPELVFVTIKANNNE